jgi:hypothetical protein
VNEPLGVNAPLSMGRPLNRRMITISIMLATVMQTLDSTIANVALPHMQGSMSASQDQIAWVLTAYIVAAAIATPLTGWLCDRFGQKNVFLASVAGFTVASVLAHRQLQLALGVLHQHSRRRDRFLRHRPLHTRGAGRAPHAFRRVRLRDLEPCDRSPAARARPRAAERLVLVDGNLSPRRTPC